MGICELLTIVFVVLKLTNVIDWTWFFVLLPEIIAFVFYIALIVFQIVVAAKVNKAQQSFFKKF